MSDWWQFLLVGLVVPLVINEFGELSGPLARKLLTWGAKRLGPGSVAERYAEEWQADLERVPGKLTKLGFAIGVVVRSVPQLRWQARRKSSAFVISPRRTLRLLTAAVIMAGVWAVVRYRLYDLPPALVVVGTVVAVVFGAVTSYALGSSLRRWRQVDGRWETEAAEPPASAAAGWAAVYGAVLLVVAAVVQVFSLRFTGWEAVLATALSFGLVLLLVTTWWVPLRARRTIATSLVEQMSVVDFDPDEVADALLKHMENHGMLVSFLTEPDPSGQPQLNATGRRVALRARHKTCH